MIITLIKIITIITIMITIMIIIIIKYYAWWHCKVTALSGPQAILAQFSKLLPAFAT